MCQIHLIIRGYRRKAHTQWETTRWLIWSIGAMLGGKASESPEEMCRFGWEEAHTTASKEEEKTALLKLLNEAREYNKNLLNGK